MRALLVLAPIAGIVLGAVRLWLQVYRPTPASRRQRIVRVVLDVLLVIFGLALIVVVLAVVGGVLGEVYGNAFG